MLAGVATRLVGLCAWPGLVQHVSGYLRCSFDYLEGVARRGELPQFEEVEIVALFRPKGGVDAVRAQLEEDIIAVGHDTLDAWPKWCGGRRVGCVCMVVAWTGADIVVSLQESTRKHLASHGQRDACTAMLPQGIVYQTH